MQDLYDGVYISMPTGKPEVSNSDYLAIEALYGKKEGEAKRGIFESIVNKYMARGSFMPSYHMTSIGECYLLDIRIKDNREQTADRLFAENKTYYPDCKNTLPDEKCTAGYKIGLDDKSGDPHIHLCLRKDYISPN